MNGNVDSYWVIVKDNRIVVRGDGTPVWFRDRGNAREYADSHGGGVRECVPPLGMSEDDR